MERDKLIEFCKTLSKGDDIVIQKKSLLMSKYGSSKKFRPRVVSYPKVTVQFRELLYKEYLVTSGGTYYYSKIGLIELLNPTRSGQKLKDDES